jgi:hypothetical protein
MKAPITILLGAMLLAGTASAQPPEIMPIDDAEMFEDTLLDVDVEVSNADSEDFLFWTEVSDEAVTVNFNQELMVIHVLPEPDWNGSVLVTFGVDDLNDDSRVGDIETFTVTVLPVNDCPVLLSAPPDVESGEDLGWLFSRELLLQHVSDVDLDREGDTLEVSFSGFGLGSVEELGEGWLFSPAADTSGVNWIDLVVSDGDCQVETGFQLTVTAVNDCPELIGPLPNLYVFEDNTVVLDPVLGRFQDVEGDPLSFCGASGTTPGWTFDYDEELDRLALTPPFDHDESEAVLLCVSDGVCEAQFSLQVLISPVNDAPRLPMIELLTMNEDEPLALHYPIYDPDGPLLTVLLNPSLPELSATWEADTLSLSTAADWHGVALLAIQACDGSSGLNACTQRSIVVQVLPVNDPPVLDAIADVDLDEDTQLTLPVVVSDVDSPQVGITAQSDEAAVALLWDAQAFELTILPDADWFGVAQITVQADDGAGGQDEVSFRATVHPVNDPPVLAVIADVEFDEDTQLTVPVAVVDVDSPQVTISAQSDTDDLILDWDAQALELSLLPAADWFGTAQITVQADDGDGGQDAVTFQATVHPVNDPPVLAAIADVELDEDTQLTVPVSVVDIDSPQVTITAHSDTAAVALAWDAQAFELTILPAQDWHGTALITVQADDGDGGQDEVSFQATVHPVNDAPVLEAIADQEMNEDEVLEIDLVFHDVDGDTLVVGVAADSEDLVVTWLSDSLRLRLEPASDWHGQAVVTVQVDDLQGRAVDQRSFNVTVHPVNDCPVLVEALDPGECDEDGEALLEGLLARFHDVDGDTLQLCGLSCDLPEAELEYDAEADALRLTPPADWSGLIQVQLCVTDGSCSLEVDWTLTVHPVNDDPVLAEIPDQEMDEDDVLEIELVFHDIDSDSLVLSASADAPQLAIAWLAESGLLRLEPAPDWYGQATVTVQVDDLEGRAVAQQDFLLTVHPVNDAPWAEPAEGDWPCGEIEDLDAFRERLLGGGFLLNLADVDGDTLSIAWFVDGQLAETFFVETQPGDTLFGLSLPPLDASWLEGNITLHVELSDGDLTLNEGGGECSWILGFLSVEAAQPMAFELRPAWPNPFNPSTQIAFTLPAAAEARLAIHDLRGALVAVLAEGSLPAGEHRRVWQPRGQASGVYFAVLSSEGRQQVQRLTLMK